MTGLRFIKKNRIIHLQIQEGKLLPRGNIDSTTVRWVPVDDYKITDRQIFNGQDFFTMNWEQRRLDLDDLNTAEGRILTGKIIATKMSFERLFSKFVGVRFKKIGSHLNFEIYTTPFDFITGQLDQPRVNSYWEDNSNTDASLYNPR